MAQPLIDNSQGKALGPDVTEVAALRRAMTPVPERVEGPQFQSQILRHV